MQDRLLCEKEVAQLLNVSESWLQKGRVYGYGPKYLKLQKPRGAVRFRPEDVADFLNSRLVSPGAAKFD